MRGHSAGGVVGCVRQGVGRGLATSHTCVAALRISSPTSNTRMPTPFHPCRQDEFAATGVSGEMYATIDKALDERTIGHNPERLCLLKVLGGWFLWVGGICGWLFVGGWVLWVGYLQGQAQLPWLPSGSFLD